jgi:hypothetical protein
MRVSSAGRQLILCRLAMLAKNSNIQMPMWLDSRDVSG